MLHNIQLFPSIMEFQHTQQSRVLHVRDQYLVTDKNNTTIILYLNIWPCEIRRSNVFTIRLTSELVCAMGWSVIQYSKILHRFSSEAHFPSKLHSLLRYINIWHHLRQISGHLGDILKNISSDDATSGWDDAIGWTLLKIYDYKVNIAIEQRVTQIDARMNTNIPLRRLACNVLTYTVLQSDTTLC